nr:hypothetical protein Iba_chr03eCG5400 [Ipomoea batatas]
MRQYHFSFQFGKHNHDVTSFIRPMLNVVFWYFNNVYSTICCLIQHFIEMVRKKSMCIFIDVTYDKCL